MNIAFVHYHLKTGGVTTALKRQVEAAAPYASTMVLTGEATSDPLPAETAVIPALGYDRDNDSAPSQQDTAAEILEAVYRQWPEGCDLLHVHNPLLAKNRRFLQILKRLQEKGIRLLLQVHDFAEDGRPDVFFEEAYPSDCHYAVINQRDYRILLNAGLRSDGLHLLSNTVHPPENGCQPQSEAGRLVYPVRAIRRKNIGEAILIACCLKRADSLAITLPPNSPVDQAGYERWQAFVDRHDLPVTFEAGLSASFESLMASASAVLTTSISEGFGYVFLEPWLFGRNLQGRWLPGICDGFSELGMRMTHLYRDLRIPLSWIDRDHFRGEWLDALKRIERRFDYSLTKTQQKAAFQEMTASDHIDFGLLNEPLQRQAMSALLGDRDCRKQLLALNPLLDPSDSDEELRKRIAENRHQILVHFDQAQYGQTLKRIHRQVVLKPVRHSIDKQRLLSTFIVPQQLSLLKWGTDA